MLARFLNLHPSTYKRLVRLAKEARRDGAYRVARRIRSVLLNADGHSSGEIATILKAPRSKTSQWLQLYEEQGVDALLEGYRPGRPAGLDPKKRAKLIDILRKPPAAYGLDVEAWTSPVIAQLMAELLGVSYHPGHVRRLLKEIGFSLRPRK